MRGRAKQLAACVRGLVLPLVKISSFLFPGALTRLLSFSCLCKRKEKPIVPVPGPRSVLVIAPAGISLRRRNPEEAL